MTILRTMAILALVGFLGACAGAAPDSEEPVGGNPMTDPTLSLDPMDSGQINDTVGTQM